MTCDALRAGDDYSIFYPNVAQRVSVFRDVLGSAPRELSRAEWVKNIPAARLKRTKLTEPRSLLKPVGYLFVDGRYTRRYAYPGIYLANGSTTGAAEALGGAPTTNPQLGVPEESRLELKVEAHVPEVVTLTELTLLHALGLTEGDLTADTDPLVVDALGRPPAYELPQCIAEVAHELKIGGLLYPSARNRGGGINLIVFATHLAAHGGWIQATDPVTDVVERYPPAP